MFFFYGHSLFLALFFPWLQHCVLARPPSSQNPHSSWVSMYTSVSCLDCLLLVGPFFLKLVARSYPKPNHFPSAVKNVLTRGSLSSAVTPWLHLYSLHDAACRVGRKNFLERKNRFLSFIPVPGHIPLSRPCPVKWGWRLLALGRWQKGTTGAEKIYEMVCGLSGCVWACGCTICRP